MAISKTEWTNFGDVNPIPHGGFFVIEDRHSEGTYEVVTVENMEDATGDPGYLIGHASINLDDEDWIEWDSVMESSGADPTDYPTERKLQDAIWYYGIENFGGSSEVVEDEKAAAALLKEYDIEVEI